MIFIFSSPRSGSTWLAKAFDSHPDTVYLHEPDIVDRGMDLLPHWFETEQQSRAVADRARQYLSRLSQNRSLRTVGTRPLFRKRYRGEVASLIRTGMIYLGKGLEKAGFSSLSTELAIPDLAGGEETPRTVIKSVSALGRVDAFLGSQVQISPVLLLRNPCAYVNSYLKGNSMGVMPPPRNLGRLLKTGSARRLKPDMAVNTTTDTVERLAWEWLLANSEAYAAVSRRGGTVLLYEDLAASPETELRSLFSKLGLNWWGSTAQFLKTSSAGDGSYYSLARDPVAAANKWKSQLDSQQIEQVRRIVCLDPIGQRYFS